MLISMYLVHVDLWVYQTQWLKEKKNGTIRSRCVRETRPIVPSWSKMDHMWWWQFWAGHRDVIHWTQILSPYVWSYISIWWFILKGPYYEERILNAYYPPNGLADGNSLDYYLRQVTWTFGTSVKKMGTTTRSYSLFYHFATLRSFAHPPDTSLDHGRGPPTLRV